jgi:hypothetical protein
VPLKSRMHKQYFWPKSWVSNISCTEMLWSMQHSRPVALEFLGVMTLPKVLLRTNTLIVLWRDSNWHRFPHPIRPFRPFCPACHALTWHRNSHWLPGENQRNKTPPKKKKRIISARREASYWQKLPSFSTQLSYYHACRRDGIYRYQCHPHDRMWQNKMCEQMRLACISERQVNSNHLEQQYTWNVARSCHSKQYAPFFPQSGRCNMMILDDRRRHLHWGRTFWSILWGVRRFSVVVSAADFVSMLHHAFFPQFFFKS